MFINKNGERKMLKTGHRNERILKDKNTFEKRMSTVHSDLNPTWILVVWFYNSNS